jgi:hypothetical protein
MRLDDYATLFTEDGTGVEPAATEWASGADSNAVTQTD